ncbi:MAG TPA: hypothetical protein VF851_07420 [Steroidobacteraceae bacterium]
MRIITSALVAVLLVGCSSQPTSQSAAAPAAAALTTDVSAAASQAAPNVVAGSAAEQKKAPPGYKAVKRDGQMFYCRKTSEIGTRFTKTECMTPDEYAEYERSGAEVRQEMQRRANMCNSPSGNCGG